MAIEKKTVQKCDYLCEYKKISKFGYLRKNVSIEMSTYFKKGGKADPKVRKRFRHWSHCRKKEDSP